MNGNAMQFSAQGYLGATAGRHRKWGGQKNVSSQMWGILVTPNGIPEDLALQQQRLELLLPSGKPGCNGGPGSKTRVRSANQVIVPFEPQEGARLSEYDVRFTWDKHSTSETGPTVSSEKPSDTIYTDGDALSTKVNVPSTAGRSLGGASTIGQTTEVATTAASCRSVRTQQTTELNSTPPYVVRLEATLGDMLQRVRMLEEQMSSGLYGPGHQRSSRRSKPPPAPPTARVDALPSLVSITQWMQRIPEVPRGNVAIRCLETVALLLGFRANRKGVGEMIKDPFFLERLQKFDCSKCSTSVQIKLKQALKHPLLTLSAMRPIGKEYITLARWIFAVDDLLEKSFGGRLQLKKTPRKRVRVQSATKRSANSRSRANRHSGRSIGSRSSNTDNGFMRL